MKKSLLSVLIIGVVLSLSFGLSSAFFSDTETSEGNVLQAGDIDLTINGENNPESIINFTDLKPGDNYIEEKIINVGSNPAFVWFHIKDVETSQGIQTEPEELEEAGQPKYDINNYLAYDLSVEDEVLIPLESEIAFNDVVSCWVPLGELTGGSDVSIFQSFDFSSSVTNWAQGDTLTFTEEFYAVQSRNNPNPEPPASETNRIWSGETLTCNSDLLGDWDLVFTCTAGCSGVYPHEMNIATSDINNGSFGGTGNYGPNPAISWDILNALAVGSSIDFRIDYNNINPSYFVDLVGVIDEDGDMNGTASSSSSQEFTWIAEKI